MVIELKSIDFDKASSGPAFAFSAKLYIDGKYIADVRNSGKDVVNIVEPKTVESVFWLKEAEKFCAGLYVNTAPKKEELTSYLYLERYVDAIMLAHVKGGLETKKKPTVVVKKKPWRLQ